jgi:hypothetical protein
LLAAVLTEIYLCGVCSWQEILRRDGQCGQGLLKDYLRGLPHPLLPYQKCVPLGEVLIQRGGPADAMDEVAQQQAEALRRQVRDHTPHTITSISTEAVTEIHIRFDSSHLRIGS